jgi:S-adenosylmethionine:tRNA ribosyltransferase-isomerase
LTSVKTSQFDYILPPEFIAQTPAEPRDHSRLLVSNRNTGDVKHASFNQIGDFLKKGDLLVINRTRVFPARIIAKKQTGGRVEILLLRKENELTWEVLVGGKGIKMGTILEIPEKINAQVIDVLEGSRRILKFNVPIDPYLPRIGQMPLPPYIHEKLKNPERYQTVYADQTGSAAAPTAGLHFTEGLIKSLNRKGVQFAEVTLHVGLDTFAPVTEENADQHLIHKEWCEVTQPVVELINRVHHEKRRIIAVGTTSVRTLETAAKNAKKDDIIGTFSGMTDLYILPGYSFKVIDGMVTNFHLPKSTLLMLVSALAGWENIRRWYEIAKEEKYRFYSFGDAMLIL